MTAHILAFPQSEHSRREAILAKKREYYAANRETILANKRTKYAEDPEQVLGSQRARRREKNVNRTMAWLASGECAKAMTELDATLRSLRPKLV